MTAYRYVLEELNKLPHCADITRKYCSKYSGILLVDGKFVKVKNHKYKIPVVYGIDYYTHDIPTYTLATAENQLTLEKFFKSLRLLNYPLRSLVSDDNLNIPNACKEIYPNMHWQLCTNHFKENIRRSLQSRTDPAYKPFMTHVEYLFKHKRSEDNFNKIAKKILRENIHDELCVKIMLDIERRKPNLLGYLCVKKTPQTNNLIECFNSHLNGRLKTIKGFESFKHADLWLNGYFIRRRTKPFSDCTGKFRKLNGICSIEITSGEKVRLKGFVF